MPRSAIVEPDTDRTPEISTRVRAVLPNAEPVSDFVYAPLDPPPVPDGEWDAVDERRYPLESVVEAVSDDGTLLVFALGSRDGVIENTRFRVARGGVVVATVEIDFVLPNHTCAHIIAARSATAVRTGDAVRGPRGRVGRDNLGLGSLEMSDGTFPARRPWRRLLRADVLTVEQTTYVLRIGSLDSVRRGDEFTISRDGHFVAEVEVDRVDRQSCVAEAKPGMSRLEGRVGDEATCDSSR